MEFISFWQFIKFSFISFYNTLWFKWQVLLKWKSLTHVWLFFTHGLYTVHGILQARILEWVSFPFPRGTSRDQTQVSCIAGGCFTSWVTRKFSINTSEFIFPFSHVNDVKFPLSPKENAYSMGTGGNSGELHTCSKLFPLFPG